MERVSIVTGSELRQVQGVNYFIKSFIECNKYFRSIRVDRVYSSIQTLNIDEGESMPIGSDSKTTEYAIRTGVRSFLRKFLTDKFYPFALLRYELNFFHNSYLSAKNFLNENNQADYIIFQEIGCAYYYFKLVDNIYNKKRPSTALVIHSEDDSGSMLINRFEGIGRKDMQRRFNKRRDFVYSHVNKVIYISQKAYNNSILPISKRAFVYNGSPDIEYNFDENKNDLIQFVCVGSFAGRKGQDKIIEALKIMPKDSLKKLHVTMVGDGPEFEKMKSLVALYNLSDYITLTGRRDDVSEILEGKDVFIMPSLVEGLPMSAIEAMRAGLYLILTDTGGNVELCSEGCGVICTRDPENIRDIINTIINSNIISKTQKMQSRNRFLREFSLESMARGYETTLKSI